MRLVLLLVFEVILYSTFLYSQNETISLEEAVRLTAENNARFNAMNYELMVSESELKKSGIFPNPSLNYSQEILSNEQVKYKEWTISGSYPINFLWERAGYLEFAENRLQSERKLSEYQKLKIITEVKSTFVKYHFLKNYVGNLHQARNIINGINQTAKEREKEGDISQYEMKRIQLEYLLYTKYESEAKVELQRTLHDLQILIFPQKKYNDLQTEFREDTVNYIPDLSELITYAQKNRADFISAKLNHQSQMARLSTEQLKIIPVLSVLIGYKNQSENIKGFVYSVNVEIPLFNRNQANITSAETEVDRTDFEVYAVEKQIGLEVTHAYNNFLEYADRLRAFSAFEFLSEEELLATADFSYQEGEMTLLELIDALKAFTDAAQLRNELITNYYRSYFQLEMAIGKEFNK